jgi:exo-beta-1,3-glucanase (GH17 family)
LLGIWLEPEEDRPEKREGNLRQVVLGVELANRYPDIVTALSVGNETQVFWSAHRMPDSTLIRYLRAVRSAVSVPVTTMDDYLYWNKPESRPVADEVDFVATHIHPLWNGQALEHGIAWLDSVYRDLREAHPERAIVIGETGWATDYDPDLTGTGEQGTLIKGEVGTAAQAAFLADMNDWIDSTRITTFLFEAFDEPWKGGGENSSPRHVEKHWGVFYENREPKESFRESLTPGRPVPPCDRGDGTTGSPAGD